MRQQLQKLLKTNFLLSTKRIESRRGSQFNCKWFLQRGFTAITNGICCGSSKISCHYLRRKQKLKLPKNLKASVNDEKIVERCGFKYW